MKPAAAGTTSSCLTTLIVFGVISICLFPASLFAGGISSVALSESVVSIVGPYLCPEESSPEVITYQTTTTDEYGNESPATAFEMQCVSASGEIVRAPSPDYAFYWIGVLAAGSLVVAGVLALVLAVPVGVLVTRTMKRRAARL